MFPKISIITVVYNDAAHIVETMDSVINQSYENIEYILIDGGSSDGTREMIESKLRELGILENAPRPAHISPKSFYLQARHKHRANFSFKFLSEKDSGIYDAMNKGIDLATGQWCNFMNCGDRFYSHSSIEEIFRQYLSSNQGGDSEFAVIYGDTLVGLGNNQYKISKTDSNPAYRMPFCHQSAFTQTDILKTYYFDTRFKICADGAFFTMIYNHGKQFLYINTIVCVFEANGLSSQLTWRHFKEEMIIGLRAGRRYLAPCILMACIFITKKLLLTILPATAILKLKKIYNSKPTNKRT